MSGALAIDGRALFWELVSEPQWASDGRKGLRVSVKLMPGANRELIIEYPYDRTAFLPQRPKLSAGIVEVSIREAFALGWDPESRGRPFLFMAETVLELGQRSADRLKHLQTKVVGSRQA